MRSRVMQAGLGAAIWRQGELLLLVVALAAKPEDWSGSRYGSGSSVPNDDWWQYKCKMPGCMEFLQFRDKPKRPVICQRHKGHKPIMGLIHDPTKG